MIDRQCAELLENAQGILMEILGSESDPVRIGRKYTARLMETFLGAKANGVETRAFRIPTGYREIPARFYRGSRAGAEADSKGKLVLFFHGGGWSVGDVDTYDGFVQRLCAETGAHYLSVDFRRAPEHKFPAAHEDCYEAALWACENSEALGIDPERIGAMGDSAGAALATAVSWQIARQTDYRVNALYLLYPFLDLRDDHEAYASRITFGDGNYLVGRAGLTAAKQWYLNDDTPTEDPLVSPMFIPDLGLLPPTTIITSGHDPNLDEGRLFAEKLRESGVRVSATHFASAFHGFMPFGVLDVAGDSVQALAKAIAEQ
ncbi:MAG: alpha/beta hydrolase [Gammaproteobacteria bacterium]|nr:alpha/beta hydrolase [Gammaproteobacteria bacterium]